MMSQEQLQEAVERMAQQVYQHEQLLQPARQAPLLNMKDADVKYSPATMRIQLGAGGAAPLTLVGLKGAAGSTQPANFPSVRNLPGLDNPTVRIGDGVTFQGKPYLRAASGWQALTPSPVSPSVAAGAGSPPPSGSGITSQEITLTGPTTIVSPTSGTLWAVILRQDATGGRTIAWDAGVSAASINIDTTASTISTFLFAYDTTVNLWVMVGQPTTGMTP